jgi:hypothetical protein
MKEAVLADLGRLGCRAGADVPRLSHDRNRSHESKFCGDGGAGVLGVRIKDPCEVDNGVAAALAHNGPVPIDAVVARTELAMPPAITVEMVKLLTSRLRIFGVKRRLQWT